MNLPDFSTLDLTASLTPAQFDARLRRVGITVTSSTIRRWTSEGLVAPPTGKTYAARWPLRAAGDVTLVFRLREGTPLQVATHDGVRVARAFVSALLDGSLREPAKDARLLHNFEWRPGVDGGVDLFLHDAALAFFRGVRGIPLPSRTAP